MARQALRTTPNLEEQSPRDTDFERHRSIVVLSEDARSLRRGFTIVELLIVVVVIAILAAITIVAYNGIQNRAYDSTVRSDLASLQKKLESYRTTDPSDTYPTTTTQLEAAQLSVSKNSYAKGSSFLYCRSVDGKTWAIAVLSRSGSASYISSSSGSTSYVGSGLTSTSLGSQTEVCPAVLSTGMSSGNLWGQNSGTWQSWVAG